jgi:hypothetical protein
LWRAFPFFAAGGAMNSLALLIAGSLLALPPGTGRTLPLRLVRGQEFIYHAHYLRQGERDLYLHTHVLILEASSDGYRAAFMTEHEVPAGPNAEPISIARLDTGRIDSFGRVTLDTPSTLPRLPIEAAPTLETYPFLELPAEFRQDGRGWQTVDPETGPISWKALLIEHLPSKGECLKLSGVQVSSNWGQAGALMWKRTEQVWVLNREGVVDHVVRKTDWRTESGDAYSSETIVDLEAVPAPMGEAAFNNRLSEIRSALDFNRRLNELMRPSSAPDLNGFDGLLHAIDRHHDLGTPYNAAIKSLRRKAELAREGVRPPEPVIIRVDKPTTAKVIEIKPPPAEVMLREIESGKQMPLSSLRGRRTLLVIFKPSADPNAEVLRYVRGATKSYAGRVTVLPLMLDATADDARKAQLDSAIYDAAPALAAFGCAGPRVIVLDRDGAVRANLPGWNPAHLDSANDELNKLKP